MGEALWKWMKMPEAQKIATSAQEKAWNELQQQYPRADRSKFEIQGNFTGHTQPQKYISKAAACQRVCLVQTRDIGARK